MDVQAHQGTRSYLSTPIRVLADDRRCLVGRELRNSLKPALTPSQYAVGVGMASIKRAALCRTRNTHGTWNLTSLDHFDGFFVFISGEFRQRNEAVED